MFPNFCHLRRKHFNQTANHVQKLIKSANAKSAHLSYHHLGRPLSLMVSSST